ncbi:hypothetical protein J2X97_002705 [Epilithonimonas hungarica]|uniref:tail fiber domain-containing protein n=1 Tax=Epilithonimonas hungarica TaxID=454006 RepID=UPI00278B8860|nr:tail fiber domain-containing protein [Epilithonimonas hungarica]MDP9957039.1 hypothetical protein [Epilithonimonas hungarica]
MKKTLLIVAFCVGCFSYGQQQWTGVNNTTSAIERTGLVTIVNNDLNLFSSLHKSIGFSTSDRTTDNVANYGLTNTPENTVTLSGWNGLNFYTGTVPRMSITNVGNVGIGTTDIQSKFQVENGDINSTGWSNQGATRRIGFYTELDSDISNYGLSYKGMFSTNNERPGVILSGYYGLTFNTVGTERVRIDDSGNVGIGKINPSSTLDVNGEITALAIKGPSDIRFKKNIKPLENSLHKIILLNGYTYEWKKDEFPDKNFKKGIDIGLIAQEVEKVFPEVVYTDKDEMKSKSIDYSKLVPVLIESIKELQKEVEELKAELKKK